MGSVTIAINKNQYYNLDKLDKLSILNMYTITASEVKQHFGACLQAAQANPVLIEKNGQPSAVILSIHEFERLQSLEDEKWGMLAKIAKEKGFLSKKTVQKWFLKMQGRLNAQP